MCVPHPRVRSSTTIGQIQKGGKRKMAEDKENSLTEESVWGENIKHACKHWMAFNTDILQTCGLVFTSW